MCSPGESRCEWVQQKESRMPKCKQSIFDCCSPWKIPVITGSKDLQDVSIALHILFQALASQLLSSQKQWKSNKWLSRKQRGLDLWREKAKQQQKVAIILPRLIPRQLSQSPTRWPS
ncbi:hypothetical protein A6R68_24072, partial [Neotoma lepida]